MKRLGLLLVLLITSGVSYAADEEIFDKHTIRASDIPIDAPTFERYSVRDVFKGPIASPDVKRDPFTRMFRTMIRQGAKQGPNFAGHYTIVFWGCGTGCATTAIVDAKTGRVFHPKNLGAVDNVNVAFDELEKPDGHLVKFRLDSKLLVVMGGINENTALRGISYFLWENEHLRRIRFVHKPYD